MRHSFQWRVGFGAVAVGMTVGLVQTAGIGCGSGREELTITQDNDATAGDAQEGTGGNTGDAGGNDVDPDAAGGGGTGGVAGNGDGGAETGGTGGVATGGSGGESLPCDTGFSFDVQQIIEREPFIVKFTANQSYTHLQMEVDGPGPPESKYVAVVDRSGCWTWYYVIKDHRAGILHFKFFWNKKTGSEDVGVLLGECDVESVKAN